MILKKEHGKQALYLQLCDIYRQKIINGEYKVGERIESEKEIQDLYGVSRITVRQAVDALEKEGYLIKRRGLGTFVVGSKSITGNIFEHQGFEEVVQNSGAEPKIASDEITASIPPKDIQMIMNLEPNECCMIYKKVGQVNDVRLAYIVTYVPMVEIQNEEALKEYIEQDEFKNPYRSDNQIAAVLPDEEVYKALHIGSGQPIFHHRSILYNKSDTLLGILDTYYRGDMFSYSAEIKKPV